MARLGPYFDYDNANMDKLAEQIDGNRQILEVCQIAMFTHLNIQTNI